MEKKEKHFNSIQYMAGATVLLLGLYLLWSPDNLRSLTIKGIDSYDAFLRYPKNQVKWKSSVDLDWNLVSENTGVQYGDSVFTGDQSRVLLQIKDLDVSLTSNTLVALRETEEIPLLNIQAGTILVKMAAKLKAIIIEIADREIHINNTSSQDLNIMMSSSKENEEGPQAVGISALEGSFEIEHGQGEKIDLSTGDNIILDSSDQDSKLAKFKFRLNIPSQRKIFAEGEKISLRWSWDGIHDYKVRLQSAATIDLTEGDSIDIGDVKQLGSDLVPKCKVGSCFLQLIASSPEGVELYSNKFEITIADFHAPKVFFQDLKFLSPTEAEIVLMLEKLPLANSFDVEVYRNSTDDKPLVTKVSKTSQIAIGVKGQGEYFFRARYKSAELGKSSPWSEKLSVIVPPQLAIPRAQIVQTDMGLKRILLSWATVEGATQYEVHCGGSKTVTENRAWISMEIDHSQKCRVTARSQDGRRSQASEQLTLAGFLPAPIFKKIVRLAAPHKRVDPRSKEALELEWLSDFDAYETQVEISPDKNFANPRIVKMASKSAKVSLENSIDYCVRIKTINPNDRVLGEYSETKCSDHSSATKMAAPRGEMPKENENILFFRPQGASIDLRWTACADAVFYDVEYKALDDKNASESKVAASLKKNEFTIKKPQRGPYQWRVRCLTRYSESDWSQFYKFEVTYGQ